MRLSRIFTDRPLQAGSSVELDERAARYLIQVLRLRVGDTLVLFDGSGDDFAARLTRCDRRSCRADITDHLSSEPALALPVHLGLGISRGERMDFAIQKSVELGVAAITPLLTERSVVQLKADRLDKRMSHWLGVLISACEQSGRSRLPTLHPPASLADWLAEHRDGLMLYHRAQRTLALLDPPHDGINLLIGPEGGLAENERALALAHDFHAVRLGPRVLRTETAPLAALAAIQVLWGDLR